MKKLFLYTVFLFVAIPLYAQVDKKVAIAIDGIFSTYEKQPGCAVAIVKNGKTIFQKGYGFANLSYDIPVNEKTIFDIGSNAQSITAACIFLLEEEGLLNLNDPIQKYVPEIPKYGEVPITISNLLYHTSGLRSFYATLYAKNKFWGDSYDNSDAVKTISKHKALNFPTGTKHYFSNTNYILLANVVEKVTGKSLGDYAHEKIFHPLGMTNTFFKEDRDSVIKNRAIGYSYNEGTFKEEHNYNATVVGHGGLHTNVEDFIKWSNNLSTGSIGGNSLRKKMITPGRLSNGKQIECSSGFFIINHNNIDNLPVAVHNGGSSGFSSFYYKFLNQDVACIILSNNENTNGWALVDQLAPLFLSETIEKATKEAEEVTMPVSAYQLSEAQKKKFTGNYYNTFNGYLRQIKLEENRLMYVRPGVPPIPLMAINASELVYETTPLVKFTFDQKTFETFEVTINNGQPMEYQKYRERVYSKSELKPFENSYYNDDIDEEYTLLAFENELQIVTNGKQMVTMQAIAEDLFTSDHSGYIKFKRDHQNKIIGFTQYDDHLNGLQFELYKKDSSRSVIHENIDYGPIKKVLMNYIEGTANGEPDRVRRAFHKDLNLYSVKNDSLAVWFGKDYIDGITIGKKNSRQGKIVSIDIEKDAATAKVEILIPGWRVFTDYFLLLKIKGNWKVIHKSYTWRASSKRS